MDEQMGELATALRERLTIIGDEASRGHPERHMARLQEVSQRIELLEQRLAPRFDAQLRHFLQRRSYTKALEYLEAGGA